MAFSSLVFRICVTSWVPAAAGGTGEGFACSRYSPLVFGDYACLKKLLSLEVLSIFLKTWFRRARSRLLSLIFVCFLARESFFLTVLQIIWLGFVLIFLWKMASMCSRQFIRGYCTFSFWRLQISFSGKKDDAYRLGSVVRCMKTRAISLVLTISLIVCLEQVDSAVCSFFPDFEESRSVVGEEHVLPRDDFPESFLRLISPQ